MSDQKRVRVLVADDDAILREIAGGMLAESGCSVQTVGSGDAAVAACLLRMPDLVLLDVEMPEGNGYQACANIRRLPGGADVPIVMVTGCDDSPSIDKGYEAGATDFVVKPINWPLLKHRIRYVLRGARTIEQLRFREQENTALLRAIPDGIYLLDADGRVALSFCHLPAFYDPALRGALERQRLVDLLPAAAHKSEREAQRAVARGETAVFEFALDGALRTLRHYECRFLPNADGARLAIIRDVSDRKEAEARIERLAYFDPLTGRPNREWIREYVNNALIEAKTRKRRIALMYIDLDQFKRINDTLGHETGDAVLRQVADRLQMVLDRASDSEAHLPRLGPSADAPHGQLARAGGDEFVVVLSGRLDITHAESVAQRILEAHVAPFFESNYELVLTPSIGMAVFPEHGDDGQTLLKNAEIAMYQAKANGRNRLHVFDSAVNARARKRLSLEMELRRAVESSALDLYYQPKYEVNGLRLTGGEALLRWFHPERGQVPTNEFIAVAEEIGLIGDIGRWVMQRVCRDLNAWRAQGLALPSIAVNISGRDFLQPELLLRLGDTVSGAGLSPSLIELELTEGVLMRDAEAGRRSLLALKEFGFTLAIDDFGTGYCSLNYLKRFPIDTLKIDRSFVADCQEDPDDGAIVRAIIALGHSLDLRIVAEGVTTPGQLQFLRAEGCDSFQGFLMSPAVAMDQFAGLLRAPPTREDLLEAASRAAS